MTHRLKRPLLFLLVALTFSTMSCQKNGTRENGRIEVCNLTWTECITADSVINAVDSVSCRVHNDKIFIERYNHAETCGFDTILVDISLSNDTLIVYERVCPQYDNNCLCIINSSFQVNNIPDGTYTLLLKRNHMETIYSQTITI